MTNDAGALYAQQPRRRAEADQLPVALSEAQVFHAQCAALQQCATWRSAMPASLRAAEASLQHARQRFQHVAGYSVCFPAAIRQLLRAYALALPHALPSTVATFAVGAAAMPGATSMRRARVDGGGGGALALGGGGHGGMRLHRTGGRREHSRVDVTARQREDAAPSP
ncbi:hypothetical protein EON68_03665, partial [archaeon]